MDGARTASQKREGESILWITMFEGATQVFDRKFRRKFAVALKSMDSLK